MVFKTLIFLLNNKLFKIKKFLLGSYSINNTITNIFLCCKIKKKFPDIIPNCQLIFKFDYTKLTYLFHPSDLIFQAAPCPPFLPFFPRNRVLLLHLNLFPLWGLVSQILLEFRLDQGNLFRPEFNKQMH